MTLVGFVDAIVGNLHHPPKRIERGGQQAAVAHRHQSTVSCRNSLSPGRIWRYGLDSIA